jgi:hypothetical protein
MPKTWSNRPYEHIDIDRSKRQQFPLAGWVIFGMGGLALAFFIIVSMTAILHPAETHENDVTPIVMPTNSAAYKGQ